MKLNDLKIGTRLNLIMGGFVVIALSVFGLYVNNLIQNQIRESTDERMIEQVKDLEEVVAVELKSSNEKIKISMNLAINYLGRIGNITEIKEDYITYNAVDQKTGSV